jgi:hypothetical protein
LLPRGFLPPVLTLQPCPLESILAERRPVIEEPMFGD